MLFNDPDEPLQDLQLGLLTPNLVISITINSYVQKGFVTTLPGMK